MNLILSIILFSQLSTPYETQVFLDADGTFLIYARYYQGEFISIDSVVSVDKYLDAGLMLRNREVLLRHLKLGLRQQGGYASQGLFGTFEIPLPKGGFSDFMGETGKLDVGGHVKITIGGSETFVSNLPGGDASDFSWLPELEMKQEMSIKLDGEVGDRMRVYIDHNSERINETENKITVTYRGREDEIIQEIEGGDTDLSIPATTYTGDIPSHRGLFGIKSSTKLGPVDIVAIASKEQTQTQEIELEGSTQAQYDTTWAKYYERRRFFFVGTYDSIIKLIVYVDDNNASNNNQGVTFFAHAYLDINDDNIPDDTTIQTNRQSGYFTEQQEGVFYYRVPESNMIGLNNQLSEGQVLGVWYVKINSLGQTDTVGIITDEIYVDTMQLKLICPDILDTLSYTWHYEKKNYYQVVAPGSKLDSLRIFYITSGGEHIDNQDGVPFIQLLGLDNDKNNLVDENVVFFQGRGLLIFPDSMPFASAVLENPDVEIYTNPHMTGPGKYYLYKKSMQAKAVFMLPDNVKKVTVYVDEVLQDSIRDYHVDYDGGILEFRKPILPTQKVRIKVEYAPFFSAAEKSLVGLRSTLRPFGDAMLGSSFFYRTESYPMDHVRLKEEPFNRMVWEVDFSYPQNLPVITKVIDWLPLIETESPSMMSVNFEGAYSFSNLNTKDEVFLDDLESSTVISNDISVAKISWSLCSKPIDKDTANFVQNRMIWYNPSHEDILQADDIYEDPLDPNEAADVLKIIFHPDHDSSFGGLTQYIYSENFEDIENLELIIKGKGGIIHIEFAQEIGEDQLRRNQSGDLVGYQTFDDEDKDNNNVWNQGIEDTGLDGVYGDDDDYVPDAADNGNDDYQTNDYTGGINGTEGNALWDTEDLNRDGNLNTKNRYFSYSVDIDDTTSTRYIGNAGLTNGWKMFRVSIKDSPEMDIVFGQPDWHDIKYVRIWFDGFTSTETLMIYKLSATGSRWKNYGFVGGKLPPPGAVFTLTPVNTKTHSYYRSPYHEEYDQFGQTKTEGGLEFMVENIPEGISCVAHRRTDENEDYRAYDTLTFYLNAHNSNPLISMRLGSDSLNFYEYTCEYENGELGFNDYRLFKISMQSFIDLKRDRDPDADTISDSTYTVVGNPSLSNNRYFEIRISNQYLTPLTDTIWFNDIKLKSPKSEVGRILRGNGSLTLADLASLNFAYDESNGRFKRLSESKDISTTSASQGYSASGNVSLDKFLPSDWHFKIPVAMSFRKNTLEPRFSYYSDDIEIEGEDREEHKSRTLMRSYTIGFSKSQSKNWAIRNTIDRLTFNHDRTQVYSRSALSADTSDIKNFRGSYTLAPKLSFTVLKQKFFPLPKNISFNAIYSDNSVKSYHRSSLIDSFEQAIGGTQYRKTLTPSFSAGYSPHSIISANYAFDQTRDSVFASRRYGEEVRRNQNFNTSFSPNLRIVTPRFTFNSSYSEDFRFEIRQDQDLRNVNNSGTYGVDGAVKVGSIVKLFTRLRDETKDTLNIVGSPGWIAKKVEKLAGYIQNVQFNYSRRRSSSYLNVKTRPDIDYQWGLVDSIPPEDVALGSFPGRGVIDNYGLSSGFNYTSLFSANGGYSGSVNRTYNYGGGQTKTDHVSYPNLHIRLMKIESLPFLKRWCRHSSVMTNFNQTFEERYDVVADSAPDLVSDSKRLDLSPVASWQASWIKGISTTLEINYSETNSRDYYADTMAVESRIVTRGVAASFAYTFSAPKGINIPLLKGIKFSSNLSMNLNVSYNRTTSYYTDLVEPATNTSTLSSTVGLSYNFSSSITGGANFDYSQNDDMNSYQNTRRVGLNVWTNINF